MKTSDAQDGLEPNQKRYTVIYDLPLPAYGIQLQSLEAYRQELYRIANQATEAYRVYLEAGTIYFTIPWQVLESDHITIEDSGILEYAFENCAWPSGVQEPALFCPGIATNSFLEVNVFMKIAAGTLKRNMLEQTHSVLQRLVEKLKVADQHGKDTTAAVEKCVAIRDFLASEDWLHRPDPHAQGLIEARQQWNESLEKFASVVSNVSVTDGLKLLEREKAIRDTM